MFLILNGLGMILIILGVISIVTFTCLVVEDVGNGLPSTGQFFVYKILPAVIFVSFMVGVPLVVYSTNPENKFKNCMQTIDNKDFCTKTYLNDRK